MWSYRLIKFLFGLMVIGIGITVILFPQFSKSTPESREELDAKLAEYQKIMFEMRQHPESDKKIFDMIISDLDPVFKGEKFIKALECPLFATSRIEGKEKHKQAVKAQLKRFHQITNDDFEIKYEGYTKEPEPSFVTVNHFVYWVLAMAMAEAEQGHTEEAYDSVVRVLRLTKGFQSTPETAFLFYNFWAEEFVRKAAVQLIPILTVEQLERLNQGFSVLPDPHRWGIDIMKATTAVAIEKMDTLDNYEFACWVNPLGQHQYLYRITQPFLALSSYMKRDRYLWLSIVSQEIAGCEQWLKTGGDYSAIMQKDRRKKCSIRFEAGLHPITLITKTMELKSRREVALTAIRARISFLKEGNTDDFTFTSPTEDGSTLEIINGCIKEVE